MAHEGVPLVVIQRQLGHANLGITSIYLQGIDNSDIIETFTRDAADDPRHRGPSHYREQQAGSDGTLECLSTRPVHTGEPSAQASLGALGPTHSA